MVLCNRVMTAKLNLDLKEIFWENRLPKKERSSPYIAVTLIWQEITIFMTTVVHLLQRLSIHCNGCVQIITINLSIFH
jgi:hypothetical protein